MPIMPAHPSFTARFADARSATRFAWNTGRPNASRMRFTRSRCGATGCDILGTVKERPALSKEVPTVTFRKSASPASTCRRTISMASSSCSPPSTSSSIVKRMPIGKRPMWVIWIIVAHPWRCTPSASACSHGMTRSSPTSICPDGGGESMETVDEPPNIESASPPRAFSTW